MLVGKGRRDHLLNVCLSCIRYTVSYMRMGIMSYFSNLVFIREYSQVYRELAKIVLALPLASPKADIFHYVFLIFHATQDPDSALPRHEAESSKPHCNLGSSVFKWKRGDSNPALSDSKACSFFQPYRIRKRPVGGSLQGHPCGLPPAGPPGR